MSGFSGVGLWLQLMERLMKRNNLHFIISSCVIYLNCTKASPVYIERILNV